jgi:hypothetical protein
MKGCMISSLGRWAAMAFAASGLALGGRPRGLMRAMMAPWWKIAAPDSAWFGAFERVGQAGRAQRALLAVRHGLLKLSRQFGKSQIAVYAVARQRVRRRGERPGWYEAGGARHDDHPCTGSPRSGSASSGRGKAPGGLERPSGCLARRMSRSRRSADCGSSGQLAERWPLLIRVLSPCVVSGARSSPCALRAPMFGYGW